MTARHRPLASLLKIAVPLLIVALAVASGAAIKLARTEVTDRLPAPLPVQAVPAVLQESFVAERSFAGRITPRRTTELGFELSGHVVEILVDDGDEVGAGETIARLDTDQLTARRDRLVAEREEVRARLELARVTLERRRSLAEDGHASWQRHDDVYYEAAAMQAKLRQIEAAIRSVETDIADSDLRAPFAAIVAERYRDEGAVVHAGTPILRLNETAAPEARIGLPVALKHRVPVGSTQILRVNGHRTTGVVTALVPDLNTGTRTLTLVLQVDEDDLVARELVRLVLEERVAEPGIWVPLTALTEGLRGLWTVFAVEPLEVETGPERALQVRRKDVEVIHTDTDRVFVRGTLEHGDLVVTSGVHRLVPGQQVRLLPEAGPAVARLAPATPD